MKDVVIPITGDLDIGRATALAFDNEGTRLPKADWRGSNGSDCAQVFCRVAGIEQVFNSPEGNSHEQLK